LNEIIDHFVSGQWRRLRGRRVVAEVVTEIVAREIFRERWQTNMGIEGGGGGGGRSGGGGGGSITSKTILSNGKVVLKLHHLPLKKSYGTNTSINGVSEPGFGFISERIDRVLSLLLGNFDEDLAHIAGSENLVHLGKFLALIRAKVRCKYTIGYASSLQELAGCTRGTRTWLVTLHASQNNASTLYYNVCSYKCMVFSIGIMQNWYLRQSMLPWSLAQLGRRLGTCMGQCCSFNAFFYFNFFCIHSNWECKSRSK